MVLAMRPFPGSKKRSGQLTRRKDMCRITTENDSPNRPFIATSRRETKRPGAEDLDAIFRILDILSETVILSVTHL